MPGAERFLGEDLSTPPPSITGERAESNCCLCSEPIGTGQTVTQTFETDPSGQLYCAHAKCAHEYGITARALRRVADDVTPSF
jgi:hypothetical protein